MMIRINKYIDFNVHKFARHVCENNTNICAEILTDWRQTAHRESKTTQRSWRRSGQNELKKKKKQKEEID